MKKGVFIDKNGGKSDIKKKKKIEIQNLKRSETAGFRSETAGLRSENRRFLTENRRFPTPFQTLRLNPMPEPSGTGGFVSGTAGFLTQTAGFSDTNRRLTVLFQTYPLNPTNLSANGYIFRLTGGSEPAVNRRFRLHIS